MHYHYEKKPEEKEFKRFIDFFRSDYINNMPEDFRKVYYDRALYTNFINGIMKRYGKKGEMKYYPEYYTIDHTFWTVSKDNYESVNLYKWNMVAAIEHENDWKDWTYEVAKLDFINCPLRVVIGYMDNSKREKEFDIIEKQRMNLKNLGNNGEFGIIMMNRDLKWIGACIIDNMDEPIKKSIFDKLDMRCYLLDGNKTSKLG